MKDRSYQSQLWQLSLPGSDRLMRTITSFSPAERAFFWILTIVLVGSAFVLVSEVNDYLLVDVPARGGSFTEGVVGSPRFINPLLATSDVDRDLTSLIYSGLTKATPDGSLIPDLARSYSISEDGLSYTFRLRDDVVFHDGKLVVADDVIFTIQKTQDPTLKSPRRASWDGIVVEKIDDLTIKFTLKQPYAPFLQNTTIGILPKHIWGNTDTEQFAFSQYNIEPIGSGPYKIKDIKRNVSGVPEFYRFVPFPRYALGRPHINDVTIRFYSTEEPLVDAYLDGEIDAFNSISSKGLALIELNIKKLNVLRSPLPRVFGVFFNQNQAPVLAHKEVRKALNVGLNKKRVVKEVLGGNGTDINSPIPPGAIVRPQFTKTTSESADPASIKKQAIDILERNGWSINEETGIWEKKTSSGKEILSFSLSTSDVPELKAAAQIIQEEWRNIGVGVDLKIFESGDLNQDVIRPRKYDALFFGEIVGRELDMFAFWHSSQRNDPGLNIALYANITADKLLEDARIISEKEERLQKYVEFEQEILNDIPAVFVYAPDFIYIIPKKINGIMLGTVTTPSERFLNVHEWYIETDNVWSFFTK